MGLFFSGGKGDKGRGDGWMPSGRIQRLICGRQLHRLEDSAPYIRQLMANVRRFSCLATSGTNGPGVPSHPSGEVVPPRPAK